MFDTLSNKRRIILASSSSRRREILANAGVEFEILVTDADERINEKVTPEEYVSVVSGRKAEAAANMVNGSSFIIIAADTIVSIGDKILGKPRDREEAYSMLKLLDNNWHRVLTGLTVAFDKDEKIIYRQKVCVSDVKFKALDDEGIQAYVNTDEPYDKAGAYAVQGGGVKFVERINGDRDNVIGLPMGTLLSLLSDI